VAITLTYMVFFTTILLSRAAFAASMEESTASEDTFGDFASAPAVLRNDR
jgi:hypothetical protein